MFVLIVAWINLIVYIAVVLFAHDKPSERFAAFVGLCLYGVVMGRAMAWW